ncbi:hypothetical protein LY76DRAFT_627232 [Colletotrichum caudatum]|nr:hypothetical protein LY76DRAFT_627232 [Colletotrichum caudatum]
MHRSFILAALASIATGSLAAVAGRKVIPRADNCGTLNNVPLSPDPDHSSYTFFFDPSVQQVLENFTQSSGKTINTVRVDQYCDVFDGSGGYLSDNFGFANITQFGSDSKYTISTDKCEDGSSRSPLSYRIDLCIGDGTQCSTNNPWVVCGTPGADGGYRPICAVTEPSGGNPKAVSVNDPTAWSCKVCSGSSRYCEWS